MRLVKTDGKKSCNRWACKFQFVLQWFDPNHLLLFSISGRCLPLGTDSCLGLTGLNPVLKCLLSLFLFQPGLMFCALPELPSQTWSTSLIHSSQNTITQSTRGLTVGNATTIDIRTDAPSWRSYITQQDICSPVFSHKWRSVLSALLRRVVQDVLEVA